MKFRHWLFLLGVAIIASAPAVPLLTERWLPAAAIVLSLGAVCIMTAAIITPTEGD